MSVDWTKPIEAVHEDGRVVAIAGSAAHDDDYQVFPDLAGGYSLFYPDGSSWSGGPWRIRNVAQPAGEVSDTSGQLPSPEIVGRMVALIRHIIASQPDASGQWSDEARAILAELEPVDGDLVIARQAVAEMPLFAHIADEVQAGELDGSAIVQATLETVRQSHQRELGRGK